MYYIYITILLLCNYYRIIFILNIKFKTIKLFEDIEDIEDIQQPWMIVKCQKVCKEWTQVVNHEIACVKPVLQYIIIGMSVYGNIVGVRNFFEYSL